MGRTKVIISIALPIIALAMSAYHLLYTQYYLQGPVAHNVTHLGFALTVVLLSQLLKDNEKWLIKAVLLVISLVSIAYMLYYLEEILYFRSAVPSSMDLFVGILIILILLITSWLVFGKTFLIITLVAIVYLVFGRYLPQPFKVPSIGYERLLMWLTLELGSGEGVFGSLLSISSIYLFLFILFGGLLDGLGGTRFVTGLGRWVGTKFQGGAALTALVGSSLVGTVTGSTVANITITGSFTIPMMKKAGYTPEQAGAIEAAASNGGQITPPVMGATAFVIAGFAGIPYIRLVVACIFPAIVYYFCIICYIYLTAKKLNIKPMEEEVNIKQLLLDSPIFILPLGILMILLIKGFTLPFVAFWTIIAMLIIGCLNGIFRKEIPFNFKILVSKITDGVRLGSEIALINALIGIVATSIKVSGMGIKLPLAIEGLSGGILLVALLIAMVASIFLGMGVPTTAAYLLVAIGVVPTLLKMGVSLISAHLFCFLFAVFSHLTPPVAIGAMVAAKMSGGEYWKTSWEAIKVGFMAFILPFLVVYAPVVILQPNVHLSVWVFQIMMIILSIISITIALNNYLIDYLQPSERIIYFLAGALSMFFIVTRFVYAVPAGIAFFAYVTFKHCKRTAKNVNVLSSSN